MSNFIKTLRNRELFATRDLATAGLVARLTAIGDGEICIASYGDDWQSAKTIFGFSRYKDGQHSYTIYDSEAFSAEITAEIAKLDATASGESADKHVKVEVVEVDGKITTVTTTTNDIASAALLGTTSDDSTKATAFGYIAKEAADRAQAITDAIEGLDSSVAATAADGNQYSVLTGVTETDGKLTAKTEVKLAAVAKTGSASDVATTAIAGDTTHVAVTGTDVASQIDSLSQTIKTVEGNAAKYECDKLTDAEVTALGDENVKEAYKIVSYTGDGATATKTQVGDTIKIYKDSSLKSADFVDEKPSETEGGEATKGQFLKLTYILANGSESVVYIDMSAIIVESEFADGLQVNGGKVSVKKDTTSEDFLSVSANGVKVSGVQNAINTAIQGLDATVENTSTDEHVKVSIVETDGKLTSVTVTTSDIASAEDVVTDITVNGVDATVEDNKATVTIDGGDIAVAESYEATVYSDPFEAKAEHIAATDKVNEALKKVETTIGALADEVIADEKVAAEGISALAEAAGVADAEGVIGYIKATDATYISDATSLHDATVKLDAAIKDVSGGGLTQVNGSNAITVSEKAANKQTISVKLDAVKTDNALSITDDGLYLSNVWDCGEY